MKPTTLLNSTLALTLLAGAASPAVSQVTHNDRSAHYAQNQQRLGFVSTSDLFGSSVENANGQEIGEVDDFVMNRGSGRLSHVIVRHGGLFGFGGDRVAVPFSAIKMKNNDPYVTVDAGITSEMISNSHGAQVNDWIDIDSAGEDWMDQLESSWTYDENWNANTDPVTSAIKNGKMTTIQGTVVRVERFDDTDDTEYIAVHVDTKDTPNRRVVFGPSWYVMSQSSAPMRGENITITAYELPRDTQNTFVATTYEHKKSKATLRDNDGTPRWNTERSEPNTHMSPTRSIALLSTVLGKDAKARWSDAGSIEGAIVEISSGRIAMLILDTDENFLGIGDDLRVVPWSIVSVQHNDVVIDADRKMLVNGNYTPTDITMLHRPAQLKPVYASYNVQQAEFAPRKNATSSNEQRSQSDRQLLKAFEEGKPFSFSGAIRGASTMSFYNNTTSMRTLRIETTNGTKTVVLGPDWFINNQSWDLSNGDQITVNGKTASLDGKSYHFAKRIDLPGPRSITLWTNGSPRWTTN